MTTAQYAQKFPTASMACAEVGEAIRQTHTGDVQSEEHKAKRAASTKRTREVTGYHWSEESRRKLSQTLKGRKFTAEHKAKIGAATQRQWDAGERQTNFTPRWEQQAAAWLVEAGLEFHHQYHIPGFSHPYDFFLPGLNRLVELDGCFWHGCACQGGPQNEFIEKNNRRDRECEQVASNFGYTLIRIRECEFSKDYFMGVCHA